MNRIIADDSTRCFEGCQIMGLSDMYLRVNNASSQYPQISPCVYVRTGAILQNIIRRSKDISTTNAAILLGLVLLAVAIAVWRIRKPGKPIPAQLRRGRPLPDFRAVDEHGDPVRSTELHGAPSVILFVRGNWCPFCTKQVKNLSEHYKSIVDLGARLILLTPKPLETTRRVAEFFEVEFDFWLDDDLSIARELGLLHEAGVPEDHHKEYGADTVWPTAVVTDANGIIRYTVLSKFIVDRPDPETLLNELRATLAS